MNSTQRDLALYDLERLGYWLEAEEAEFCWNRQLPWPIPLDVELPRPVFREVTEVNHSFL